MAIEWQGRSGEGHGVSLEGATGSEDEGGDKGKEPGEKDRDVDCRGLEAEGDGSDLWQWG